MYHGKETEQSPEGKKEGHKPRDQDQASKEDLGSREGRVLSYVDVERWQRSTV